MIIVCKKNTSDENIKNILDHIECQGVSANISKGVESTIIGLVGDTSKIDVQSLEVLDSVEKVQRVTEPYKLANRKFHTDDTIVDVNGTKIGGKGFAVIAGPCSVESEEQIVAVAKAVKASGATFLRGGAFKPRTSPYAFRGLKARGLELLRIARQETGLPIVTELMSLDHLDLFVQRSGGTQVRHRLHSFLLRGNDDLADQLGPVNGAERARQHRHTCQRSKQLVLSAHAATASGGRHDHAARRDGFALPFLHCIPNAHIVVLLTRPVRCGSAAAPRRHRKDPPPASFRSAGSAWRCAASCALPWTGRGWRRGASAL